MRIIVSMFTRALDCFFIRLRFAYLPLIGPYYGLGNRIKSMASLYSYGTRNFLMAWNASSWVTDVWANLFVLEGARVCSVSDGWCYSMLRFWLRRFVPLGIFDGSHPFWSFRLPKCFWRDKYRHEWSFMKGSNVFSIDFKFGDIDDDVRKYFLPFFEALKPSEKVLCRIGDFHDNLKDLVAVQIRNTDSKEDAKDVASIASIQAAMDEYPKSQRFFISAMTQEIVELFKDKYGDRVLFLPDKNCKSMIDAVADMWILGHCREMIASPGSTFSEVAWWWGGAQIPVMMLKVEYNQGSRS